MKEIEVIRAENDWDMLTQGACVAWPRDMSQLLNNHKTRNLSPFWSILKWIELDMNGMDLGSKGQTPHVGARLKALDEAVLMAASDFSCNFFHFPRPRIWTMCLSSIGNDIWLVLLIYLIFCGLVSVWGKALKWSNLGILLPWLKTQRSKKSFKNL